MADLNDITVNVVQVGTREEKIETGIGCVDICLNGIWTYLVPTWVKERYPILEWHSWFIFFCVDFVGDTWFTIATLVLKRSEIAAATSSGVALVLIVCACVSIAVSLVVLCVRWFRLRPLMASMGWKLPQDEVIDHSDQRHDRAVRALSLEKRVGVFTALGEDFPQTIMTIIVAVYLQEVTLDMVVNSVTAVLTALRILWVAFRTFLLSDRERPLVALFHATNGRSWYQRRGWGTARVDLGKWHGMRVDRPGPTGRVVALDLHRNNLCGELPTSFVQAMDALGVVPGLWGNPRLRGIPPHWQERQREMETEAARQYEARRVGRIDIWKAIQGNDVDEIRAYLSGGGGIHVRDEVSLSLSLT